MKKVAFAIIYLVSVNIAKGQDDFSYLPEKIQGKNKTQFIEKVCSQNNIQDKELTYSMFVIWRAACFSRVSDSSGTFSVSAPDYNWSQGNYAINHMFNRTTAGMKMYYLQARVAQKTGLSQLPDIKLYDIKGLVVYYPPFNGETAETYVFRLFEEFNQSN